jgi:hypothetical protein
MSGPHYRMARAPYPDLDEYVETVVRVLREQGPLTVRALRGHAQTRYWGPGCLGAALRRAREQGRIRRAGFRTYAAT